MSAPMHPGEPLALFRSAFEVALAREPFEANAMTVASIDEEGRPSARVVLLRGVDDRGFVFFTNYESRKGRELVLHPVAALCLHWPKGEEQVRVEGDVERVSPQESDAYFASRPRGSQLGAWASLQSQVLPEREQLEARVRETEKRFEGREVERPTHWGGFRVVPRRIEFWYGRPSRLHERHVYRRANLASSEWHHELLYP
jgi:pyridoxamine 5'-phosphate oxidase